ncbi:MAG: iron-containing alcohol dehydrogenase [Candidatus Asgardarchaeia archaeon]
MGSFKRFQVVRYPKIIFGDGALEALSDEISLVRRGYKCGDDGAALIVTDRNLRKVGILEKVEEIVERTGVDYDVFDEIFTEPKIDVVKKILDFMQKGKYELVIGVGGGSSLDVAKIASVMATNPGTIEDYLKYEKQIGREGLPTILIPTTSGSGSEISYAAVVFYSGIKIILRSPYLIANTAIVDPLLTVSMPPSVTASSGLDAFSHAIETYVSRYSNPLSESLSLKAIELILENLPRAYTHGEDIVARHNMSLASLMAEMAATSGAGGVCLPHAISHCLPEECHLPHGILCAIIQPHFLELALSSLPKYKLTELARILGKVENKQITDEKEIIINTVKILNEKLKVPSNIPNFKDEDIPEVVEKVLTYFKRQVSRTPFDVEPHNLKVLLSKLIDSIR